MAVFLLGFIFPGIKLLGQVPLVYKLDQPLRVSHERFGTSLAVSGDRLIIGAPLYTGNNGPSGRAFVYERDTTGRWNQNHFFVPPNYTYQGWYGIGVDIESDTVAIVHGSTGVMHLDEHVLLGNNNWGLASSISYQFGLGGTERAQSVDLDGDWIAAGFQTRVRLYKRSIPPSTANVQHIMDSTQGNPSNTFGNALVLNGKKLFIGDHEFQSTSPPYHGGAMGFYLLDTTSTSWKLVKRFNASVTDTGSHFGFSCDLHNNILAVGATYEDANLTSGVVNPGIGAVHLFKIVNDTNIVELQTLIPSDGVNGDHFGSCVKFTPSGDLLIGAIKHDLPNNTNSGTDAGAVYYFERAATGNWREHDKLIAPDREPGDWFGSSIAVYSDGILIGAPKEDHKAPSLPLSNPNWYSNKKDDAGSVYDFTYCWPVDTLLKLSSCDTVYFDNQPITESGVYSKKEVSQNGCDSTVYAEITIYHETFTDTVAVCNFFEFGDTTYFESGIHEHNYINQYGCDSTIIINLTIFQPSSDSIVFYACDSAAYNGRYFFSDTSLTDTLVNHNGCDSILKTGFKLSYSKSYELTDTVCHDTILKGRLLYTDTSIVHAYVNAEGCDSVVLNNIVVLNPMEYPQLFSEKCIPQEIAIPNAFTPGNNDNLNENFEIYGLPRPYSFEVYDRWGKKLYSNSDYDNSWNGYYKGKLLPKGVYVYVIQYDESNYYRNHQSLSSIGETKRIEGYLYIVR